jgi:hypothetical protein
MERKEIFDLTEAQGLAGIVFLAIEKLPKIDISQMDMLMGWLR